MFQWFITNNNNLDFSNSTLNNIDQAGDNFDNIEDDEYIEYDEYEEYNEHDEYDDEYDEFTMDDEIDFKKYDESNKKSTFSGKAGPYFSNYTHFLLFMWITKHQIGMVACMHMCINTNLNEINK